MPHLHDTPGALKALQDDIYRERVLRARRMTPAERIAECIELSNRESERMLAEAMSLLGTTDEDLGWAEVRRWVDQQHCLEDATFFTTELRDSHSLPLDSRDPLRYS